MTTEPKLHNLPKERYLPAEVTTEIHDHVPRRGIELEADYQNPFPVSTVEPDILGKKKTPGKPGVPLNQL